MKQVGVVLPSEKTLSKNRSIYLEHFDQDLVQEAICYFKPTHRSVLLIGCFNLDASAINQDVTLNTRKMEAFGVELWIVLRDIEEWKGTQFLA